MRQATGDSLRDVIDPQSRAEFSEYHLGDLLSLGLQLLDLLGKALDLFLPVIGFRL